MIRKNLKKSFSAFIVGVLLSVGLTAANAGLSYGTKTYYGPSLGYKYFNQASIYTTSSYAQGRCLVESTSGTVPAGYMGVKPYLYNEAGTLISSGEVNYNSSPVVGHDVPAPAIYTRGNYYGQGHTLAWNGSSYSWHLSTRSPNLTF